jgi:hypothetical protein
MVIDKSSTVSDWSAAPSTPTPCHQE